MPGIHGRVRRTAAAWAVCFVVLAAPMAVLAQDDTTPPTLADAWTEGAGAVERLVLQFDEPVDATNATMADFTLQGCTCAAPSLASTTDQDDKIIIRFDAEPDTGLRPTVSYNVSRSSVRDLAGNALDDPGPWQVRDAVDPVATAATTQDADADGRTDAYALTISEPVTAAGTEAWSVDGADVLDVIGDGAALTVRFTGIAGTGSTPEITAAAGAHDAAGNPLVITAGAVDEADGAPPVLLAVRSDTAGSDTFTAHFSEPVHGSGGGISSSEMAYDDVSGDGAAAIAAVTHSAGSSTAELTLDAPASNADIGNDTVTPGSDVADAAFNAARTSAVPLDAPRTASPDPPPAVDDLQAEALDASTVRLSWTTPPDANGTFDIRIDTAPIDQGSFETAPQVTDPPTVQGGASQSVEVTGRDADTDYWAALRIIADDGTKGPMSNVAEARTPATTTDDPEPAPQDPEPQEPEPVTDLAVVEGSLRPGQVDLRWTAPAASDSGSVAWYELRYSDSAPTETTFADGTAVAVPSPTTPGTTQSVRVTGLPENTTVFFAIRSHDSGETSMLSNLVEVDVPAAIPAQQGPVIVSSPTHEAGVANKNRSAVFTWDGPDVTYRYALAADIGRGTTAGDATTTERRVEMDVVDGTWYFHVTALTADGPVDAQPYPIHVDTWPPEAVEDLAIGDTTDTSTTITWTAPADTGGTVDRYEIRYSTGPLDLTSWETAQVVDEPPAPVEPGMEQSVRIGGLEPGKEYRFGVRAVDAAGNQAPLGAIATLSTASTEELKEAQELTLDDIDAINREIRVHVQREGPGNRVAWTLPDDLPAQPRGIQIWVANSPFTLAKTLYKDDPSYRDGSWYHEGQDATADSRYVVTVFFDTNAASGFHRTPPENLETYAGATPDAPWWSEWVWPIVGIIAVLAIGLWWFQRRLADRDDELDPDGDVPPGEASYWDHTAAGPPPPVPAPSPDAPAPPPQGMHDPPPQAPPEGPASGQRRSEPSPPPRDEASFEDLGHGSEFQEVHASDPVPARFDDAAAQTRPDGHGTGMQADPPERPSGGPDPATSRGWEVVGPGDRSLADDDSDVPQGAPDRASNPRSSPGPTDRREAPAPDVPDRVMCSACANLVTPRGNLAICSACGLEEPVAW